MQLHADDDGFVRAPIGLVYRQLSDIGGWPAWWPGLRASPLGAENAFRLVLRASPLSRPVGLRVQAHTWRHDLGFVLDLDGDLQGRAEFWLESGWGGTVVHHPMQVEAPGNPRSTLARYRASLRRGLGGLKDDLQSRVRERLELQP